ncbi:dTDP-4-dehydrorhamnose reductase [Thioalkalivibrio sulfidiphilus]|uniref:dTDP-4-dehydrorhamnose reductase n=1 Tax=Thioalkalivibrio sulfidiphilus TaxID=1033854 RepID=UPI003B333825
MRILLFGANGQVGWELQRALAPLGEVIALDRGGLDGLSGDLAHPDTLADTIRAAGPEVIVNAAAYTAVDKAESEEPIAQTVNAAAPAAMAKAAKGVGALLVHYSTDYVFDGSGDQPWKENDQTGPLNVYGRTKLEGEMAIQQSGCHYLVFRTSWVYASRGHNFIRTMLRLSAERESLQLIDDQHGAPTGAELIADITAQVIPKVMESRERAGLYHLASAGETNWHDYASFVIERAREAGWPVKVSRSGITAVKSDRFPVKARRPLNSRLACTALESAFGIFRPDWRVGVSRALREILACENLGARQ